MIAFAVGSWQISPQMLVVGALTGLAYALLASGLVLVYRATRVINFAHGQVGAFAAALLAKVVLDWHWNFFIGLVGVLVVGGLVGAVVELGVVRRLFESPRLVLLVATIGVSQLLLVLEAVLPDVEASGRRYPAPIDASIDIGSVHLGGEHLLLAIVAPVVIVAIGLFVNRSWHGVALRAAAENADRAELVGISTKRVSTMVWVLAGVLSAVTAVLLNPVRGTIVGAPDAALGPGLLLRALTAAMLGGLVSLPLALAGGIAVGLTEAVMFANVSDPGSVDLVLFAVVLALVFGRRAMRNQEDAPWSLSPRARPIPADLRDVGWVRRLPALTAVVCVAIAAVLPLVFTSSARAYLFSTMVLFALVGLSVTVLTGWAGQLSLGQFAFVGLGATVCGALHDRGMPFAVAVAYATTAGVLAALLIGFPALRARGLYLAVTTLAFAVAARSWIFVQDVFLGDGTIMYLPRGEALGIDFRSQRAYYYLCLVVVTLVAVGVARLRSSGVGRSIIATRENESAAASFTISPALAKLTAFGLSGGIAALAGALLAGLRVQFGADAFGPEQSLQVVAMTIIGGLGSVGGPILGALYVVGLPALFDDSPTVGLATSGIGLLVLLLYLPGGLMQIVYAARDALFARARNRRAAHDAVVTRTPRERHLTARPAERSARSSNAPALAARGVTVRFGGRLALDDVTIVAERGEVIGLIGANGAGKSTFLNVAGGYVPADRGRIEVFGVDVTSLPAHRRARHGVGRVFQDARLFGDLTVAETVKVALEAGERSELVPSLLRLPPARRAERAKESAAAAYIDFLGLGRYADRRLAELSTGTRRIVELCCLLAQGADLLLLDEPTAGVAQRESEAFGPLIRRVQSELGATILIVEHDMPLVLSISDRVYCLSAGAVIAEGRPEEVRADPLVISTYLGNDDRAIFRSGAVVGR